MQKLIPYLNGWMVFGASAVLIWLFQPLFFSGIVSGLSAVFPAPFNGSTASGLLFLAAIITLIVKFLDAPKLGSGERYRSLVRSLAHRKGVTSPRGLAAYIGRQKYGNKDFQKLAAAGRKRKR